MPAEDCSLEFKVPDEALLEQLIVSAESDSRHQIRYKVTLCCVSRLHIHRKDVHFFLLNVIMILFPAIFCDHDTHAHGVKHGCFTERYCGEKLVC